MYKITWDDVYKLEAYEFSEDPDKYAEPNLIHKLGDTRKILNESMYPSPVPGALARLGGRKTSQHYVGNEQKPERLSTASDQFIEGIPLSNYSTILSTGNFMGIGIYLDTNGPDGFPWIMIHLDIRVKGFTINIPLIWIAEKVYDPDKDKMITKYRYPQYNPEYWKLLQDNRLYGNKKFGTRTPSTIG